MLKTVQNIVKTARYADVIDRPRKLKTCAGCGRIITSYHVTYTNDSYKRASVCSACLGLSVYQRVPENPKHKFAWDFATRTIFSVLVESPYAEEPEVTGKIIQTATFVGNAAHNSSRKNVVIMGNYAIKVCNKVSPFKGITAPDLAAALGRVTRYRSLLRVAE